MSTIITVLLVIANVLGAGMIVPQVVRVWRSRSVQGLSGSWIGVGLAMNLWWLLYAVAGSLWGIFPVSAGALVLYGLLGLQYTQIVGRSGWAPIASGAAVVGIVPFPALALGGWAAAGVTVGFCYGIIFIPAAVEAFRSDDVSGISPTTWIMALGEAAIWLVYGLYVTDPALITGGAGGSFVSVLILGRIWLVTTRSSGAPRTASSYRRSVPSADRVPAHR